MQVCVSGERWRKEEGKVGVELVKVRKERDKVVSEEE